MNELIMITLLLPKFLYISFTLGFLFLIVTHVANKKSTLKASEEMAEFLDKYPISSNADAFKIINDASISLEDRNRMVKLLEFRRRQNKK